MLNANRTYYLTRSQPPFLSSMFVDVYDAMQKAGKKDPVWLAKAYADLEKDYEMWNRDPHVAGDTGLSRYYDFGEGPPAEAAQDESGSYRKVATYFFFIPRRLITTLLRAGLQIYSTQILPLIHFASVRLFVHHGPFGLRQAP